MVCNSFTNTPLHELYYMKDIPITTICTDMILESIISINTGILLSAVLEGAKMV